MQDAIIEEHIAEAGIPSAGSGQANLTSGITKISYYDCCICVSQTLALFY
jgi:hypothetical protein